MINTTREEPGKKFALILTFVVHGLLVAALFLGVQWKRSQPEVMEVELWSPTPQPAKALPPQAEVKPLPEPKPLPKVEPKPEPPPPKKPDIAVKQEKKPEPKKPEEKKPEPKKPEPVKPEPKPDPFKEMLEREERQRNAANTQARLAAQAEVEQRASASKRGLADYASKIRGKVRGNIVLPPGIAGNPEAIFEVNQLPSGEVLAVRLKRSSGSPALDTAIERAILKSSPLPKPDDPSLFERSLEIKYRPFEE